MSRLIKVFLVGVLLIPVAFIVWAIFAPYCGSPEIYLMNDFGGCELID